MGGSAGGLLMGAWPNMAPSSYRVIVSEVPFVDIVTTMLDETIPLTTNEFGEWATRKIRTYYDYMLELFALRPTGAPWPTRPCLWGTGAVGFASAVPGSLQGTWAPARQLVYRQPPGAPAHPDGGGPRREFRGVFSVIGMPSTYAFMLNQLGVAERTAPVKTAHSPCKTDGAGRSPVHRNSVHEQHHREDALIDQLEFLQPPRRGWFKETYRASDKLAASPVPRGLTETGLFPTAISTSCRRRATSGAASHPV